MIMSDFKHCFDDTPMMSKEINANVFKICLLSLSLVGDLCCMPFAIPLSSNFLSFLFVTIKLYY